MKKIILSISILLIAIFALIFISGCLNEGEPCNPDDDECKNGLVCMDVDKDGDYECEDEDTCIPTESPVEYDCSGKEVQQVVYSTDDKGCTWYRDYKVTVTTCGTCRVCDDDTGTCETAPDGTDDCNTICFTCQEGNCQYDDSDQAICPCNPDDIDTVISTECRATIYPDVGYCYDTYCRYNAGSIPAGTQLDTIRREPLTTCDPATGAGC